MSFSRFQKQILSLTIVVAWAVSATAADWSDMAFPVKTHDFGACAVAAKTEYRFPVFNHLGSDLHLATIRASCGCTTPTIETPTIKPGQSGTILAKFNTDTFRGKKGATLTVVIDRPFYSEVTLRVDGYIRSDMVFHPGSIEFGTVNQGEPTSKASRIMYAGRPDWQVIGVRANQPWIKPAFKELTRTASRTDYELSVTIDDSAPKGFFQDEIIVTTNDRSMPNVPLRISGFVESALTISPQAIALGNLKPGQQVSRRLVVKSREPCTIDSIDCDGWDVNFQGGDAMRKTHLILVNFTPIGITGPQRSELQVKTTGAASVTAKIILTGEVRDQ